LARAGGTQAAVSMAWPFEVTSADIGIGVRPALGVSARLWDEFSPQLYDLDVRLVATDGRVKYLDAMRSARRPARLVQERDAISS